MQNLNRRQFLNATAGASIAAGLAQAIYATEQAKPRKFQLGTITYNVSKNLDLPTLLDVCQKTGIAAVELTTTHKHGVEPSLSARQRKEIEEEQARG